MSVDHGPTRHAFRPPADQLYFSESSLLTVVCNEVIFIRFASQEDTSWAVTLLLISGIHNQLGRLGHRHQQSVLSSWKQLTRPELRESLAHGCAWSCSCSPSIFLSVSSFLSLALAVKRSFSLGTGCSCIFTLLTILSGLRVSWMSRSFQNSLQASTGASIPFLHG